MTDEDLVQKKLAFIETCLSELRSLARADRIATDVKERRFVEHTLQICIQAVQDIASHIVSDERLGSPAEMLPSSPSWFKPAGSARRPRASYAQPSASETCSSTATPSSTPTSYAKCSKSGSATSSNSPPQSARG